MDFKNHTIIFVWLGTPLNANFTLTACEPTHHNGRGPLPKENVGHYCVKKLMQPSGFLLPYHRLLDSLSFIVINFYQQGTDAKRGCRKVGLFSDIKINLQL